MPSPATRNVRSWPFFLRYELPPSVLYVTKSSPGLAAWRQPTATTGPDVARLAGRGDVLDAQQFLLRAADRGWPVRTPPNAGTAAAIARVRAAATASRSLRLTTMAFLPTRSRMRDGPPSRRQPTRRRAAAQAVRPGAVARSCHPSPTDGRTRDRRGLRGRERRPIQRHSHDVRSLQVPCAGHRGASWRGWPGQRRPWPPAHARPSAWAGPRPGTGRHGHGRPWRAERVPSGGQGKHTLPPVGHLFDAAPGSHAPRVRQTMRLVAEGERSSCSARSADGEGHGTGHGVECGQLREAQSSEPSCWAKPMTSSRQRARPTAMRSDSMRGFWSSSRLPGRPVRAADHPSCA